MKWRDLEKIEKRMDRETANMVRRLGGYIKRHYGKRCPDYEEGCPVCEMWKRHDWIEEYTR